MVQIGPEIESVIYLNFQSYVTTRLSQIPEVHSLCQESDQVDLICD